MYFPNTHHWTIKDVQMQGAFYAVHLPVTAADMTFDGCRFHHWLFHDCACMVPRELLYATRL